jgi:hypothetical protein
MPEPVRNSVKHWLLNQLLWDGAVAKPAGFRKTLWATRYLLLAFAGAVFLTWREWIEHRPPEIALIAVIHFFFVLGLIAVCLSARQRLGGRIKESSHKP